MTTIPSLPFKSNDFPTTPGAYMTNSGSSGASFPIFCSINNLNTYGMADIDDYWLVMPNYSLTIYADPNYSGTVQTISAQGTIQSVHSTNTNRANAVRLYYNGAILTISGIS